MKPVNVPLNLNAPEPEFPGYIKACNLRVIECTRLAVRGIFGKYWAKAITYAAGISKVQYM